MHRLILLGIVNISLAWADLLVDLPDGRILGSKVQTENYTYYAYRGIPYGTPPLGELRFQAPLPNEPWDGILDATEHRSCCIAMTMFTDLTKQSEDCLFLNVYTPAQKITEKLPVMFWIHGGGFKAGCGNDDLYDPYALTNEGVIVVTINYRLGIFGFLSTQDEVVLGNAGLKDQLLAMKWTQKNIEFFGGDPEKVTIFGESAGGISVGAHIVGEKSAGLYRAAICQSGCSLTKLTFTSQSNSKKGAYDIAKAIDPLISDENTTTEIRDFFLRQPASVLTEAFNINSESGPVIEVEHEDAYITQLSYDLVKTGKINRVPLIIGTTSDESVTVLEMIPGILPLFALGCDMNPRIVIPSNLTPKPGTDLDLLASKIKTTYAGNGTFVANTSTFIEFASDYLFTRSTIKQVELQSQYTPVYFYEFSYFGAVSHGTVEGVGRVGHGEDVYYLFNTTGHELTTSGEFVMRRQLARLWTNFAKILNPTPDPVDPLLLNVRWPQASRFDIPYLDIDETIQVKYGKKKKEMHMWNEVFYVYGEQPFDGF
ncbi:juvenile hormone esterase-like [Cylas formicarius]|uniref:juvenile hormone esterase-like n=1 Tax=Cylas formicarius TaxID=197179 RepID=UPI00295864E7|nr:juvenile hormone esterase-like [Cylas formicarius]